MEHEPLDPPASTPLPPVLPLGTRLRVQLVHDAQPAYGPSITNAMTLVRLLTPVVRTWDRERFLAVPLDGKNAVIGLDEVHVGALTSCAIHPREVFKAAILANAASLICVHNHPSGDPAPSDADRAITRTLKDAGTLLGIPLFDHIILAAGERYFSFVEAGEF